MGNIRPASSTRTEKISRPASASHGGQSAGCHTRRIRHQLQHRAICGRGAEPFLSAAFRQHHHEYCAGAVSTRLTLATGLTTGTTPSGITNNFAFNKNYLLGYVQVWDFDVQDTLPLNIVLNVDYNGAKGTHLDLVDAPNRQLSGLLNPAYPSFNYEDSIAFSNYNGLVVRANKRLQQGISMGATYTYSHAIDDASSIGQSTAVVAQNQQDILAEEGNSSFDIRHQVSGQWLYELPFGPNTRYFTSDSWLTHTFSNLSISGTFDFATGMPLSPRYRPAAATWRAVRLEASALIEFPARRSLQAEEVSAAGSTSVPSPLPSILPPALRNTETHLETPSRVLEPCQSICRCQRQSTSGAPVRWNSAGPRIMYSTRCNMPPSTATLERRRPARSHRRHPCARSSF